MRMRLNNVAEIQDASRKALNIVDISVHSLVIGNVLIFFLVKKSRRYGAVLLLISFKLTCLYTYAKVREDINPTGRQGKNEIYTIWKTMY